MQKNDRDIIEQLYDPKTKKMTWREFIKGKMSPYMKKYGSHGAAMRQIAKEWKEYKSQAERALDPGWNAGRKNTLWNRVSKYDRGNETVRSHTRRTYDPAPRRWMSAMIAGIRKSSDVRDPEQIVRNIWKRLPASKQAQIVKQDAAGTPFRYDLPLPDDHPTRCPAGTVRVVDPFNLAEVQVNVSPHHFKALDNTRMFEHMKRNDGTIALVKRCKSSKGNCNIFIDKEK
uniref:Uncharacterized protein n=1 Tax=viral metagenome TaxID=1070528 RepID=A0A6H2A170_9ZZZZ